MERRMTPTYLYDKSLTLTGTLTIDGFTLMTKRMNTNASMTATLRVLHHEKIAQYGWMPTTPTYFPKSDKYPH